MLFVGYQAQGSLGRVILEGAQRVRISGSDVTVRAQILELLGELRGARLSRAG